MVRRKEESQDNHEVKNVAAVERALTVLDAFRLGERSVSLTELAERTGIYKSTVLRLIRTLETYGYVARTEEGSYRIGLKPFQLGVVYQQAVQPHDLIFPILRKLVDATDESASFNVQHGDQRVCLYRVESPQRIRDHLRPGDILPLGVGAAGKILLAFTRPDDPVHAELREDMVLRSIADISSDTAGVAAPVFGKDGIVAGALAVSGPRVRFDDAAMARIAAVLRAEARLLTSQLGGDERRFETKHSHRRAARR